MHHTCGNSTIKKNKQEEGMEIQYDFVLGDRLCCIENQRVYILPEKDFGSSWRLMQYNSIAINVIVENKKGGINSCDSPYSDDIQKFNNDYLRLTSEATAEGKFSSLEDAMMVRTSAMIGTGLDCIVNQYTDLFCNPMLMWGSYRRGFSRTTLPIPFQFSSCSYGWQSCSTILRIVTSNNYCYIKTL